MAVDVFIGRCSSYKDAERAVGALLGKIKLTLPENPKILLKPNLLMPAEPDRAITTHPAIVAGVCKFFRRKYPGARIYLGDSSGCLGLSGTKRAFEVCGMLPVIKRFNVIPAPFEDQPIVIVRNTEGVVWKELSIPEIVTTADLVVNLPKLKTHAFTMFTGAVKNLYGCLPGGIKGKGHVAGLTPQGFCELVLDVYQAVMPGLHLMDAVVGMEGAGPSNGTPKQTGYILASTNGVALDAACLRLVGIKENIVYTQVNAKRRGLYPKFRICGSISKVKYKTPSMLKLSLLRLFPKRLASAIISRVITPMLSSPHFNYQKCTKCYTCIRICPVKAISKEKELPVIGKKLCIHCLCCAEHCPEGAITTRKGIFSKKR